MNRLVKEYKIKPYKNTIPLVKISYSRGINPYEFRNKIIKTYKSFFEPHWIERGRVSHTQKGFFFLSYQNISTANDFLYSLFYGFTLVRHG